MNLLVLNLAGIPTSTQRLHQVDGTHHLLSEQLGLQPLAIEKRGLRGDDVQIAGNSPHITVIGDFQSSSRVLNCGGLRRQCLR
jgi:hypothetical protein